MSSVGPVLVNYQENVRHLFGDKLEFSIGRSLDSSLSITSRFISRNQCLIKLTKEKKWAVSDLSSFKSTKVNSQPLRSLWQTLKSGDVISFTNYDGGEFTFYENSNMAPNMAPVAKKRKLSDYIEIEEENSPEATSDLLSINSKLIEERQQLVEMNRVVNENYQKIAAVLEKTQKSLETVETEKTNLSLKLMDLNKANESLTMHLEDRIELLTNCEKELERVVSEKVSLQEAISNGSINVNKGTHLGGETDSLLEERPHPVFDLNSLFDAVELNATKEELELARKELAVKNGHLNEILAEKDLLSSHISDLLEQELSCSVCSEVLYQATSLQCRHTFCGKCLTTWKRNKKECPVCRTKIKSEVMPLVVDSLIDKLAEFIGGEFKKRRDDMKQERAIVSPGQLRIPPYSYPQTGRRGRRNSRNSRRGTQTSAIAPPIIQYHYEDSVHRFLSNFLAENLQHPSIDLTSDSPRVPNRR